MRPRLYQDTKNQGTTLEYYNFGNKERAVKHWAIAASAGDFIAMHHLRIGFEERGFVSRETIDSILEAYNNSCVK